MLVNFKIFWKSNTLPFKYFSLLHFMLVHSKLPMPAKHFIVYLRILLAISNFLRLNGFFQKKEFPIFTLILSFNDEAFKEPVFHSNFKFHACLISLYFIWIQLIPLLISNYVVYIIIYYSLNSW